MTAHHIKRHRPRSSTAAADQPAAGTAKEATGMSNGPTSSEHGAGCFEIRVGGHLASRWGAWFDGMTLTRHDDGTTVLSGTVTDQAALHGLLRKLNDLGVPLVSVTRTTPQTTPDATPDPTPNSTPNTTADATPDARADRPALTDPR
jgi:hypothetical protein